MIRIAICGIRGRMGGVLVRLARERDDIEIVGGIGRVAGDGAHDLDVPVLPPAEALDGFGATDVIIDFSAPATTAALLEQLAECAGNVALVIGTTGLDDAADRRLDDIAGRKAVLTAANFSPGVNLLLGLTKRVAAALDPAGYDIEIVEAHHRRKADAPSGTALALGDAAAQGRAQTLADMRRDGRSGSTGARPQGEIGFHAVRGGGIVGEHRIIFAAEREVIELKHEALDRAIFAEGALAAALWIAGRAPGRYTMQHVMGF